MNPSTAYFLTESVRHARTLPHSEMMSYLRGLSFATTDNADFDSVRAIYRDMTNCEAQLELIASGQLRLDLADREGTTKKRARK